MDRGSLREGLAEDRRGDGLQVLEMELPDTGSLILIVMQGPGGVVYFIMILWYFSDDRSFHDYRLLAALGANGQEGVQARERFHTAIIELCFLLQPEALTCAVEMLTFLEVRGDVDSLLSLEDWKG